MPANKATVQPRPAPNIKVVLWLSAFCLAASASMRAPRSRSRSLVTSASCGDGGGGSGLPQPVRKGASRLASRTERICMWLLS
jgi:hypothetical protein